jgi:hypothetical protein
MADGPVANLPPGFDAYAGYTNVSGIGRTYPAVVAKYPNAHHLSITTDGAAALCADVESGAMSDWRGYPVGYCAVSNVNSLVARYGRPTKLWTAHYDPRFGSHICGPKTCNYGGNLVTAADGTQWTDHGSADWDESILLDDFFILQPQPTPTGGPDVLIASTPSGKGYYIVKPDGAVEAFGDAQYHGGVNNAGPGGSSALPAGATITGVSVCPTGGYWLIASDGNVYAFGGAPYYGNAV